MASQYLCNQGEIDWSVGRRIFGFLTVRGIRSAPFHSEYILSLPGQQERLVIRVPYATRFKTEEEQHSFDEKIHQWVRLGTHPHVEASFHAGENHSL